MNENMKKVEDIFLEKINQMCRDFGLNSLMAQLYAILYFSNKPLSLDDMVERLKISKGSASVNVRILERYSAVRKIWVRGSRRDYYEAEIDIFKVLLDRGRSMAERRLSGVNEMIDASYKAINSAEAEDKDEREALKVFKERLERLKGIQTKAQSIFNLLNSGLVGSLLNSKPKKQKNKENEYVPINKSLY